MTLIAAGMLGPGLVTGGLLVPSAPVVVEIEPNPTETVFTLGAGGATWDGRIRPGFDLLLASTLLNSGIVVSYDDSATFDAAVWRGGGEASLFAPAMAWVDSTDGTFTATLTAGQTTGLDPGSYRFQIGVTSSGVRSLVFDGQLEITDAPGDVVTRVPYVALWDLRKYYDQIEILRNNLGDTTGFLDLRILQSDDLDYDIAFRYQGRPGYTCTWQTVPNPVVGWEVPDPTATAPSRHQIAGYLAAGGLIRDRYVREMVARRVIADVLDRQEVSGKNGYREEAQAMRDEADAIWCGLGEHRSQGPWRAQIDTSDPLDAIPDLLIGVDATILPSGTAP